MSSSSDQKDHSESDFKPVAQVHSHEDDFGKNEKTNQGSMELDLITMDKGERKKDRVEEGVESEEDRKAIRRLVWKFDLTLLPVLTILCE